MRGNNPGVLIKYFSGIVNFESGQIYVAFNSLGGYLGTQGTHNLTGFNTLYSNGYCIENGSNTAYLSVNTSNGNGLQDNNSAVTSMQVTPGREYTIGLNISAINAERYIHVGGFLYAYIYRVWLA